MASTRQPTTSHPRSGSTSPERTIPGLRRQGSRESDLEDRRLRLAYAIGAAMSAEDLTPTRLALRLHRSPNTIARWIKGETVPSALELKPLADVLSVRYELFVDPPEVPVYPIRRYRREKDKGAAATA